MKSLNARVKAGSHVVPSRSPRTKSDGFDVLPISAMGRFGVALLFGME